jgi:hypothetical protein
MLLSVSPILACGLVFLVKDEVSEVFIAIWCIIFIVFLMFEGGMCSSSYCLMHGYVLVDSYSCTNDNVIGRSMIAYADIDMHVVLCVCMPWGGLRLGRWPYCATIFLVPTNLLLHVDRRCGHVSPSSMGHDYDTVCNRGWCIWLEEELSLRGGLFIGNLTDVCRLLWK